MGKCASTVPAVLSARTHGSPLSGIRPRVGLDLTSTEGATVELDEAGTTVLRGRCRGCRGRIGSLSGARSGEPGSSAAVPRPGCRPRVRATPDGDLRHDGGCDPERDPERDPARLAELPAAAGPSSPTTGSSATREPRDPPLSGGSAWRPRRPRPELEKRAGAFASGRKPQPVLELLTTIVQRSAGRDGKRRSRLSDTVIQEHLDAARRHRAILLLGIQPGRATFLDEVKAYARSGCSSRTWAWPSTRSGR